MGWWRYWGLEEPGSQGILLLSTIKVLSFSKSFGHCGGVGNESKFSWTSWSLFIDFSMLHDQENGQNRALPETSFPLLRLYGPTVWRFHCFGKRMKYSFNDAFKSYFFRNFNETLQWFHPRKSSFEAKSRNRLTSSQHGTQNIPAKCPANIKKQNLIVAF